VYDIFYLVGFAMNKTLEKLKSICQLHGVEFDYEHSFGNWSITFDAPPKHCWVSSTCTVVCWNQDTLKGIIGWLRHELSAGFYKADEQTLRETGQLD